MQQIAAIPPFGRGDMGNEWRVAVAACSVGASGKTWSELLWAADGERLALLAGEHGVTAHLARKLNELKIVAPRGLQEQLKETRRRQILSSLGMTAEMFRLLEELARRAVEVLVIKGPVLSERAYGDPGMRQYGDVDILLRSRDVENATRVMTDAGYYAQVAASAIQRRKIPGEYLFRHSSTRILVELHTEESLRYFPKRLPIDACFSRKACVRIDGHEVPAMAPEDELVHICVHGTKHLWERLLWIADIAAILDKWKKESSPLDWNLVWQSSQSVGAERMLRAGLGLASALLQAPLPEEMQTRIQADRGLQPILAGVERRLPFAGHQPPGLLERASYRIAMRGGGLPGLSYLWRLAASPTERDWREGGEAERGNIVFRRFWRLAKQYGRKRS